MTEATKKYKNYYLILFFLSWALTLVPLIVFAILGMCNGEVTTTTKVSLGITLAVVLVMTVVNISSKLNFKLTLIWGMLLMLYCCVDKFLVAISVMFICTAIDELIVSPLKASYRRKFLHNKDQDTRERLNATNESV